MNNAIEIETRLFADDGRTPNNPRLPLVVVRRASMVSEPADWFEQQFISSNWRGCWRWTVYPYHHFHSTNHEVLGVSRGTASLMFGGEQGEEFKVKVGDVIVIPAGVSHKRVDGSDDFQVVGAYPDGKEPDLILPGYDLEAARRRIAHVAFPEQDPVFGVGGPLFDHWKNA
ncbi:MAG: cupin [Luteolibacter sp.]|uniref:cupin n=1 Tax=Luteolibacter sp. TaxID=1962973 RepID=UPI003266C4D9